MYLPCLWSSVSIRIFSKACYKYQDFVDRGKLLTNNFFSQDYRKAKLVSTVEKFYGRPHDPVDPYNVAVSKLISDLKHIKAFKCRIFVVTDLFHGYIDMAGVL